MPSEAKSLTESVAYRDSILTRAAGTDLTVYVPAVILMPNNWNFFQQWLRLADGGPGVLMYATDDAKTETLRIEIRRVDPPPMGDPPTVAPHIGAIDEFAQTLFIMSQRIDIDHAMIAQALVEFRERIRDQVAAEIRAAKLSVRALRDELASTVTG